MELEQTINLTVTQCQYASNDLNLVFNFQNKTYSSTLSSHGTQEKVIYLQGSLEQYWCKYENYPTYKVNIFITTGITLFNKADNVGKDLLERGPLDEG